MLQLLALDGGKWSASHPGHFSPQESAHGTPLAKQAGQRGKEKILTLLRNKPHHPATQYRHCTISYLGC